MAGTIRQTENSRKDAGDAKSLVSNK